MFWVILGHTFLWGLYYWVIDNTVYAIENVPKTSAFQPVANSYLSVDSFFVMSGLLLSYLGVKEMKCCKGKASICVFLCSSCIASLISILFCMLQNPSPCWVPCGSLMTSHTVTNQTFCISTLSDNASFSEQCYRVTW